VSSRDFRTGSVADQTEADMEEAMRRVGIFLLRCVPWAAFVVAVLALILLQRHELMEDTTAVLIGSYLLLGAALFHMYITARFVRPVRPRGGGR